MSGCDLKHANFARYQEALGSSRLLDQPAWSESNRWFYALLCDSADMKRELLAASTAAGIEVRPLWYLNHMQKPYRGCRRTASHALPASMTPCSTCHAQSR